MISSDGGLGRRGPPEKRLDLTGGRGESVTT